jgi:transcriptional regulator with XRE-family HTH domain
MANERLRGQLVTAGLTVEQVAMDVGVDPKTIERWITLGRVPHPRNRLATANALGCEEAYLWPDVADRHAATQEEFICLYPHRGSVPAELWSSLARGANDSIDILVYAGLFLWDGWPDLPDLLAGKAADGTRVRLLFGDPDSDAVRLRGEEEGIHEGMASRIRIGLGYLGRGLRGPELQVRLHSTTLYNSIYRFDDNLLVNTHVYGAGAPQSPVLHYRRLPGGRLFSHYMESFDRVWAVAIPWQALPNGGHHVAR